MAYARCSLLRPGTETADLLIGELFAGSDCQGTGMLLHHRKGLLCSCG